MFSSIGGAIRRAVTPIIGNLLASGNVEEESDNSNNYSSGDESNRDENENAYPDQIDAASFLDGNDNSSSSSNTSNNKRRNNNRNKGRKNTISFEEAPSEGDTGAGIGLRLKTTSSTTTSQQQQDQKV